jgi:hypothetical protein
MMPSRIRTRLASLLAALLIAVLVTGVAATTAGAARGRIAIGDSVMLGARQQLRAKGIRVDATVSRQFGALPAVIRQLRRAGKLRETVIVHLGNNGYVELPDCKKAVRQARGRTVYLVTVRVPRQWRRVNNQRLARCDRAFARAHLIDWYTRSKSHGAWFASDGYHLTALGAKRYAGIISRSSA